MNSDFYKRLDMFNVPTITDSLKTAIDTTKLYDQLYTHHIIASHKILLEFDNSYLTLIPKIKNVIFNPPYTIVFWVDDTKTTVTCGKKEVFDEEKGIAFAITKKVYGNKGSYIDNIKPFLTENIEKQKATACKNQQKIESELKAEEERRRQRHIKNLAKKRLRKERLEREVQVAMRELKIKENGSFSESMSRAAKSMNQCGMALNNIVGNNGNS